MLINDGDQLLFTSPSDSRSIGMTNHQVKNISRHQSTLYVSLLPKDLVSLHAV
jgi:hypothetical protein